MGQGQGEERARLEDDQGKSATQLRAEIKDVREDLGNTAAALAAKTDVKTRAREKADELKRSATGKKDELVSKVKRSSPGGESSGDGVSTRATSAVALMRTKAQQNPVPTAAFGALLGGFVLGRMTGRRE